MNKLISISIHIYTILLHLYPHQFLHEFEEEMVCVFTEAITEAAQLGFGALLQVCTREIWDWPKSLFVAYQESLQTRIHTAMMQTASYQGAPGLLPVQQNPICYVTTLLVGKPLKTIERGFDIMMAIFGLLIAAPTFIIIAFLIKLDSPGSIIFQQKRMGKNEETFTLYKFRSMVYQPETNQMVITRVGYWIRRLKWDETPQLLNILKGDMSLFGYRPEYPRH
ncbi:MAG: sugar transferase [Anaerolineae bacterium]|nr:sugar transferase [Anaerolineae bacterium]